MKSLIYGITGQIGSYLAEKLLKEGHEVIGVARRVSIPNTSRIAHILPELTIIPGDISDAISVHRIIAEVKPDRLWNLAAQSFVGASFAQPKYTWDVIAGGTLNVLEAVLAHCPNCKVLHMSSSEMYGSSYSTTWEGATFQNESTPFAPCSPYAIAKIAAHNTMQLYRKSYNLFACNAIVFNNESPRRGEEFVTKKIIKWAAEQHGYLKLGYNYRKLKLGNVFAKRDWSASQDVVDGICLLMSHKAPIDCCFSSGETHTVLQFLTEVIRSINPQLNSRDCFEFDTSLNRPSDVEFLRGDSTLARTLLGWNPKYNFKGLVYEMLTEELRGKI